MLRWGFIDKICMLSTICVDWRHHQWTIMLCGWSIIHYGFYYWFKYNYILLIYFRLSKKMTNLSNFNNWFNKFAFAESHFLFMWCDDMIMHFCFFWKNLWFVMTESLLSTPGLVNSSPSVSVHQHYQPGENDFFNFSCLQVSRTFSLSDFSCL